MNFHEKLDFLMNITKTSNSTLAQYIRIDASLISRLRRGKRELPKKQNYIKDMALYFARHCSEEYQRKVIMEVIGNYHSFSWEEEEIAGILHLWLLKGLPKKEKTVEGFLHNFSDFEFKKASYKRTHDVNNSKRQSVFYGIEGKREAVLNFLSLISIQESPQLILLFSDEDIEWLKGDHGFMLKWASLMMKIIENGNTIKIIHTVSQNLDEMLTAIENWMPLYMTGSIKPYYYPKKRDGVFKRTLFIAPKTAAVISTSVGKMEGQGANFLLKDKKVIQAMSKEFNNYLDLCKPLMHIFTPRDKRAFLKALFDFEDQPEKTILRTDALSILTIPESFRNKLIEKVKMVDKDIINDYLMKRKESFEKNLKKNKWIEIIKIPDISFIKDGKVRISNSYMFHKDLYYTAKEYQKHLENVVVLLKKHKNYHVYISNSMKEKKYILYVKEEVGAIISKTTAPPIIFTINESNMIASFWDYLNSELHDSFDYDENKKNTIDQLQSFIEKLKNSI